LRTKKQAAIRRRHNSDLIQEGLKEDVPVRQPLAAGRSEILRCKIPQIIEAPVSHQVMLGKP